MATGSAEWRPDPTGRHQYRLHDGQRWTEQVADNGEPSIDRYRATDQPRKSRAGGWRGWAWWRWSLIACAVFLVLAMSYFVRAGIAYDNWDRRVSEVTAHDPYFELGFRSVAGAPAHVEQLVGRAGWSAFFALATGVAGGVGWHQERRRPIELPAREE